MDPSQGASAGTPGTSGGGNTVPPPDKARWRRVCFTLNNYSEEEYADLLGTLGTQASGFVVGKEVGSSGTPHLQCYAEFRSPMRLSSLKEWNHRVHWEKARGTREQNLVYCRKEGSYVSSWKDIKEIVLEKEYKNVSWRPFQKVVIDLLDKEPDPRKIHWFWEPDGNTGKSFLVKYLAIKHNAVMAEGKRDDIFNQVAGVLEKDQIPRVVLVDIPRSSAKYVSYSALEKVKNGCLYSGKYEGARAIFPIPHVVVFSNEEPDRSMMSADRWDVHRVLAL